VDAGEGVEESISGVAAGIKPKSDLP